MWNRIFVSVLLIIMVLSFNSCNGAGDEPSETNRAVEDAVLETTPRNNKIVLIGLDGATWKVLLPLARAGRVPNIARLMERGSWGPLESEAPTLSPVIWTTIVTGVGREKHGINDFVVKLPGEYDSVPITSNLRIRKALWNIFSEHDRTVGFINWWASWPAEKVNGFVITNNMFYLPFIEEASGTVNEADRMTYPPEIYKDIEHLRKPDDEFVSQQFKRFLSSSKRVKGFTTKGSVSDLDPESTEFKMGLIKYNLQSMIEIEKGVAEIGNFMYVREKPDLFGLYLEGIDMASHQWWKYMEPFPGKWDYDVSPEDVKKYGHVIPDYYEYTDGLIGRIMENVEEGTTFFIVSDHGFQAKPQDVAKIFKLNLLFSELGLLTFKDESSEEVDYSKTKIVDYAHSEFWGLKRRLYVNLKERDSTGIVEPGREYGHFVEEVVDRLASLKTKSGNRVFREVYAAPKEEVAEGGPDIWAVVNHRLDPNEDVLLDGKPYPVKKFFVPRPASGQHDIDGIFIISGPGIKEAHELKGATIFDITPTVLYAAGLPVADDMDGRVIEDAFLPGFIKDYPVSHITSYENGETVTSEDMPISSKVDESVMERLKSLGYVQ